MVELKKKSKVWFSELKATSASVMMMAVGVLALAGLIACQQTASVKPPTSAPATEKPVLLDSQCVLCHPQQPETIEKSGNKHKTEVGCQDCHVEHPPKGTEAIPACSMCHSGEPHYELEQCSNCHTDTHAPLDLKLEGEITGPCLTCHQQQGDEVKAHPSAHTDLPCNECHAEVHKAIPECTVCHEKHTADMDFKACVSCHPVHMPLVIGYGQDVPSPWCGACHGEIFGQLSKNQSKHHDLSCVYCHKDKHKMIPPCANCHPEPHPEGILKKFPECSQCHGNPHDLKA